MSSSSFHRFPALPPELRFQIWEAALSAPSVWAAVRVPDAGDGVDSNTPAFTFTMTFVGPAPSVAGMSSKESWRLLKRSYLEPIRGPAGSTQKARPYWVHLNHTVVYLGDPVDASEVLAGFTAETLVKFKHVALLWHISQFGQLARACRRLATACPALCTIIIQWCEEGPEGNGARLVRQSLTEEAAAYYADIPAYTGRQLDCHKLDTPYFRAQLLQYFGASPPRLHLLVPDTGRRDRKGSRR